MELKELQNMRIRQVGVMNVLIITAMAVFIVVVNVLKVPMVYVFIALGLFSLIHGVVGLLKIGSTKSFIPLFEQIVTYEKQKMGNEWYKQRRSGYTWNIIMGNLLFIQAYWIRHSTFRILLVEEGFFHVIIMIFFILLMSNIVLIIHIKKVDRSSSVRDMKGYTWKSNLIAVVIGILVSVAVCVITILAVISGI